MTKDFLKAVWLRAVWAVDGSSLKRETNHKVSIFKKELHHVSSGYALIRVVFRIVRSLVVPILPERSFIEKLVKVIFPPKHMIVYYISAPVPIILIVIETNFKKTQYKQKTNMNESATVVEDIRNALFLIHAARQTMVPPRSKSVVLATMEAGRLIQVDARRDWNIMHLWKAATVITDVFLKHPLDQLIIKTSTMPL